MNIIVRFTSLIYKMVKIAKRCMGFQEMLEDVCNRVNNLTDKVLSSIIRYKIMHSNIEEMLYVAWEGQAAYYNNQSLNNYIRRLRNLLEDHSNLGVQLHRGLGYSLVEG